MSFRLEKKTAKAFKYRTPGSTLLAKDAADLSIVYNKYKSNSPLPSSKNQLRYNLIFTHGTGFNKGVWNYHIKKLYQLSQSGQVPWFLDSVIAMDALGHGDSSVANKGKLGPIFTWYDGSKDVVEVIKQEQDSTNDFKNDYENRNIIVGHSMGGFMALYAAFLEPQLFDACIPIEAVYFGQPGGFDKFKKLFKKISGFMMDTFDSKEEVDVFFKQMFFTKKFHPQVLEDFMENEIYQEKDSDGNVQYKLKNNNDYQRAAYYGAFSSIPHGMLALSVTRVPIYHVIGKKGTWNPPESITWIRKSIDPDFFGGAYDIPEGEHLVNGERPDDVVEIITDVINKRNEIFKKKLETVPEIKFGEDKSKVSAEQFENLLEQNFDQVYGYEVAKEDMFRLFKL